MRVAQRGMQATVTDEGDDAYETVAESKAVPGRRGRFGDGGRSRSGPPRAGSRLWRRQADPERAISIGSGFLHAAEVQPGRYVKYIAFKDFHLALDSSPEKIRSVVRKVKDAGLELYGGGVIYMRTEQQVRQAFAYAKAAGMKVIIGVPKPNLLPLVDKMVKQYDIKVAIHNHGPGDNMHIKDVSAATAKGHGVEIGRGVIDIPAVLRSLIQIDYSGIVSFEYEKDAEDPMPGLAESVGYVRGVLAAL